MIIKSRILLAVILCSVFFMSCEPEAIPSQDSITETSKKFNPVSDSGSEQNDEDHRGED